MIKTFCFPIPVDIHDWKFYVNPKSMIVSLLASVLNRANVFYLML